MNSSGNTHILLIKINLKYIVEYTNIKSKKKLMTDLHVVACYTLGRGREDTAQHDSVLCWTHVHTVLQGSRDTIDCAIQYDPKKDIPIFEMLELFNESRYFESVCFIRRKIQLYISICKH